jgi:hypothetical protein
MFGCETEEEKLVRLEKARQDKESTEKMIKYEYGPNPEIVALLALKYKRDLTSVEDIIEVYLSNTDEIYKMLTSDEYKFNSEVLVREKSEYEETVTKLAIQFSLDPSIVASILFDFKIWQRAAGLSE